MSVPKRNIAQASNLAPLRTEEKQLLRLRSALSPRKKGENQMRTVLEDFSASSLVNAMEINVQEAWIRFALSLRYSPPDLVYRSRLETLPAGIERLALEGSEVAQVN
jgi:hypothetical protein